MCVRVVLVTCSVTADVNSCVISWKRQNFHLLLDVLKKYLYLIALQRFNVTVQGSNVLAVEIERKIVPESYDISGCRVSGKTNLNK